MDRTDKASPHWSRGLRVGEASLNHPPALAVGDPRVLIVFRHGSGPAAEFKAVGLDRAGHVLFSRSLETGSGTGFPETGSLEVERSNPGHPLLVEGSGGLHLLWSAGGRSETLLYGRLDWDGEWLTPPRTLLQEGLTGAASMIPLADGGAYAVSSDGGELRGARISPQGEVGAPRMLWPSGQDPYLQRDDEGGLHLAWASLQGGRHELFYGRLEESGEVRDVRRLGDFRRGTGQVNFGPVLGLGAQHGYVLWSIENRGGMGAGSAEAFYVRFSLDGQAVGPPARLAVPESPPVSYESDSELVPGTSAVAAEGFPSSFTHYLSVPQGSHDPLPVATTAALAGRTRTRIQPVIAYLGPEGVVGWEEAGHVRGVGSKSTLRQGPAGEWHLGWLAVGGSYSFPVYYSSTRAQVKAHLDARTASDVRDSLALYGWSLLTGLGLGPIMVALWTIPAALWLIVFFLVSASDDLRERRVQVAFGVALLVYLLAQLFVTPGIMVTLPWFGGLTQSGFNIAVLLVPTLILLVATAATLVVVRRREITSLPKAFFLFVVVDALLVMLLYLPGFVLAS